MKKIDWILEHARKPIWGLCFVSAIVFIMVFPMTDVGMKFCLGFFSPVHEGKLFNRSFRESVDAGDYAAALKTAEEFEPWEKKAALYQAKRDNIAKENAYHTYGLSYPSRYILAYDLSGKYDDALTWIAKRQEIPDVAESSIFPTPPEYLNEYLFAAEGRIHFKNGEKRKAFLDYMSLYERRLRQEKFSPETSPKVYGEGLKYLLTMNHDCGDSQCHKYFRDASCFNYSEFLDFMMKEYDEMGRPEEYGEAMAFFQELNDLTFDYGEYAVQKGTQSLKEGRKEWFGWAEICQVSFGPVESVVDHVCKSCEKGDKGKSESLSMR